MKKPVMKIKNLTKKYGSLTAVDNLSLDVYQGEIFGFLGPNGAGKTTTIRVCLDLLNKNAGEIKIFGLDFHAHSSEIRRRTGYLPGDFGLIPDLKVKSFLKYLLGLSDCKSDKKMKELAERLDLDLTRKNQELSKGNRQKVGVVQAFMADQELIILDEPTGGLDPLIQQEFFKILDEAQAEGKTIFMSSHTLAEVEAVCDRVAIIREGKLKMLEKISKLQEMTGKELEVEFRETINAKEFDLPGVTNIQIEDNKLTLTITENIDDVIKRVADHKILNMNLKTFSLEQLFLKYYADEEPEVNITNNLLGGGAR
ncbi:ABC transporter ATP-binding protein [[Eubacterium] cellulosolvens]